MANPNLLLLSSVQIEEDQLEMTTTMADIVAAVASDTVVECTSISCTGIHDTVPGLVTLVHKVGGTEHPICNKARVPVKQMPVAVLTRSLILKEGDSLRGKADSNSTVLVRVAKTISAT